ncbi:hypothetical protein [Amycolatopsis sp. NPDC006125]|uniref:hypothetical protein n=1 Tax=Amycolatopsis sp. NPDC006125 TaxID=3156730 RepID=UPI0033B8D567
MHTMIAEGVVLEVELGGDAPGSVENADAWVTLADGTRWTATFLTYAEIGRIMGRHRRSGEYLSGGYFTCPADLVVLAEPGVRAMLDAVVDLVATGGHESVLHRIP